MSPRALLLALAALPAAACWVPLERGRQMELRIDRLEDDSRRLEEQRAALRDRIALVDKKLLEGQAKVDRTYRVDLVDRDGTVHAEVEKILHISRRVPS